VTVNIIISECISHVMNPLFGNQNVALSFDWSLSYT